MSLPRYDEYKDSGVEWLGSIPEHWSVEPLKRRFYVVGGSTPKSDEAIYWDGDIIWVSPVDLSRLASLYITDSARKITAQGLASCGTTLVPTGSIVLSTRAPIGSLAVAATTLCTNQGCKSLIPRDNEESIYFAYVLRAATVPLNLRGKGTTFVELSADELGAFKVPVPPRPEQVAVARFLDRETTKIDALIAEQEKLVTLLAEKRQATISFTATKGLNPCTPMKDSGVAWLGEVPAHWQLKRIKHVKAEVPNAFVDGPFGSNLKSEHFIDDGDIYVIESNFATQNKIDESQLKTISRSHFDSISRSEVVVGDIVIAKIGANFGKSSILPQLSKRSVVSGNALKLTVNPAICRADWVHLQLANLKANGEIDLLANGSAQPALSLGGMNTLPVVLPPLAEQAEVLRFVAHETGKLDTLRAEAERAIGLLKERRNALVAAAVTGHIDVRSAVSAQMTTREGLAE